MRRWCSSAGAVLVLSGAATVFWVVSEAVPAPTRPSSRPPGKSKPKPKPATPPGGDGQRPPAAPSKPVGPTPPPPQPPGNPTPPVGGPFAGLGAADLARFNAGRATFLRPANPADGLGPVFTENACARCHRDAAPGGAGERQVTRFGRFVAGQFDPMVESGGPLLQNRGIGRFNGVSFVGEVIPRGATVVAHRRTVPVFGLGLVDAVPDAVFLALAQHEASATPATAGRASVVIDPATGEHRVGKFGWKAQQPTLFAFAGDAFANEMGVTTPLFPTENCPQGDCSLLAANPARRQPNEPDNARVQQVTEFMTLLAPPPRGTVGAGERAGQALFATIGCADCHVPQFQTGPHPVRALSAVAFSPYSDFLLHDMGSLGDGTVQNLAGPREMRTAPLWGLRFQDSLLHDGRASNADQAVRAHDGQARPARDRYVALTTTQKAQLVAFLNSL